MISMKALLLGVVVHASAGLVAQAAGWPDRLQGLDQESIIATQSAAWYDSYQNKWDALGQKQPA